MRFEFATANRIVFGPGTAKDSVAAARELGTRALVVTGRSSDRAQWLISELDAGTFPVEGEPAVETIRAAVQLARDTACDVVIGFGGGSAIDAGKAVAALLANPGDVMDYLEVVGAGKPLTHRSAPYIAMPTTAGTGSEVTRNAVLASPEHRVKASLRSPHMLPHLAIVDPELTLELPPEITASTGLDALTQLIEPYVSGRGNAMTDMFCVEGMWRVARSLRRAFSNPSDREARTDMSFASLLGGLALANAGLGIVHGFAAPIGGMFSAPHGAVCAALLPHGMRANIRALRERNPEALALRRYDEIARIVTGRSDAKAADGVEWVEQLCADLNILPLGAHGIGESDVHVLVEKAAQASSTKGNPISLTADEMKALLNGAR